MERWRLRACPRCGGDMFLDKDLNAWYEQCLQCSYSSELKSMVESEGVASSKAGEAISETTMQAA